MRTFPYRQLVSLVSIALSLLPWFVRADDTTTQSLFDQLSGVEIREIVLHTAVSTILDNRRTEEYQAGRMVFRNRLGQEESWSVKVKPRGRYRRRLCDFPPLMLNFDKDDLRRRGLATHDKIKLVTHCTEDRAKGRDYVLREYLAYQLYRQLTPNSYRVQLVRIRYIDDTGRLSSLQRYGFLIEDTDEMAERLGGEECTCQNPLPSQLDPGAESVHAMFQYFIGNTDYSLPMGRNVKLVQPKKEAGLIPVGYDFDFAGLVNANYAVPATQLGQLTIQQRIYLGLPTNDATLHATIDLFRSRREALLNTVQRFKLLGKPARDEMTAFIESFYLQVDQQISLGEGSLYARLRGPYAAALPDGAVPEHYGR